MKTLIVSYLPRGDQSSTRLLAEAFVTEVGRKNITHLDLLTDPPEFFTEESMQAYLDRNYAGKKLSQAQAKSLAKMDRFTRQLKAHDIVALVFPTFNFSVPGPIKAYLDSVMLHGETYEGENGLLKGKKAVILNSSGRVYEGDLASKEHAVSLARTALEFMGFEVKAISAQGTLISLQQRELIVARAQEEVRKLAKEWYAQKHLSKGGAKEAAKV